ncbi:MAG: hypothetical protein AVDCRST_MAG91-2890 [uncultured Sphingomonadaceae bacterium]|uniref:AB hydrolase-1 domain-containing protein n=1 Tax=uncultured Sphingomonadaceae bacterium TaxID=169976 RepID=A0A6J4TQX7_9SPHN|nr:MAG: hypothetical protein AVDCRST_MAG91-2890 [uncultured Sphingomonadaceae bacterium]
MKPIAAVTALAASAMLTACGGLVRSRIYHPPTARLSPAGLGPDVREIGVATADGLALRGLERPPSGDMPVLLFFHGNASSASGVMAWLRPLLDRGYGFVSAEYRGYSGNPGSPTQAGLTRDADAFHAHARRLAGSRPLIVVGHSLGGGVAFDLALRHRFDALVTIGTFASIRDVAPRIARAFIPDPFDNRAAVAKIDEPLFLIHGDRDDVISLWHARELQEAAAAAKRDGAAIVLSGEGHQPDAAVVAAAIDAIRGSAGDLRKLAVALPKGARVVPF